MSEHLLTIIFSAIGAVVAIATLVFGYYKLRNRVEDEDLLSLENLISAQIKSIENMTIDIRERIEKRHYPN